LPLAVSLLFSVHPIVTESINWISGRTDIMMSTFVLISLLCILHYLTDKSCLFLVAALFSSIFAFLAKEAALGYIIGLPLLLLLRQESSHSHGLNDKIYNAPSFKIIPFLSATALAVIAAMYTDMSWLIIVIACCYLAYLLCMDYRQNGMFSKTVIIRLIVLASMLFGCILCFVMVRKIVFTSSVGKIGQTVQLMLADINYSISMFLGAIGLYVKKFFFPLPLNFFIHEIDPLYDLLGITAILLIVFLLTISDLSATFGLLGFLMLAPALPFAFGTIAWTSYAERYIYLSSAFWILALGLWIHRWLVIRPIYIRYAVLLTALLCALAGYATFSRNGIWNTNVSLMRDTVAQTPKKRILHDIYINALLTAGLTAEAEHQYRYASSIAPAGRNDTSDLKIGAVLEKQKRFKEALQLYQDAVQRTKFSSEKLLNASISLITSMQQIQNISQAERKHLLCLEQEYREKRSAITHNPLLLMEEGNIALKAGSYREAISWFDKALSSTSKGDVKLIKQIEYLKRKSGEQH